MTRRFLSLISQRHTLYNARSFSVFQYSLLLFLLSSFTLMTLLFALREYLFPHDVTMIIADIVGAFAGSILLINLLKHKNLKQIVSYTTLFLFFFLLAFSIINQNREFGLIWSIFFPAFAILLMGVRFGLVISLLYYSILFPFAYSGIGVWENGAWTLQAFLRFSIASVGAVFVLSLGEYSRERAFRTLNHMRAKERRTARKLWELSNKDHLTDLYNRRKLQEVFPQKIDSASRSDTCFCFFLLDVDYFKQYNDTYGHQQGDKALKSIADILRTTLRRDNDIVFRLGGEEFGGIILGRSNEAIKGRLDAIMENIRAAGIEHKTSTAASYLSVSIGAVISQPLLVCHFLDYQFSAADNALYQCKSSGRDCCSVVEL